MSRSWGSSWAEKKLYILDERSVQMERLARLDKDGNVQEMVDRVRGDSVGYCWAKDRLRPGDIILVDRLNGDNFYECYLVSYNDYANRPGVEMQLVPLAIGMYGWGGRQLPGLTDREYRLLLAGEKIEIATRLREPEITPALKRTKRAREVVSVTPIQTDESNSSADTDTALEKRPQYKD